MLLAACRALSALILDRPELLISSDTLLPAAFVWDMLHFDRAWNGFQHPRVLSFVPDLPMTGTVQAATGSWRVALAVWVLAAAGLTRCLRRRRRLSRRLAAAICMGIKTMWLAGGAHLSAAPIWESPLASCVERTGLHVEQITPAGAALLRKNDRLWCIHDIHGGSGAPDFRFIVIDGLRTDRITATYG